MSLRPETQLLHFRLIEQIGEGGMGVVWKAVDTTLDGQLAGRDGATARRVTYPNG